MCIRDSATAQECTEPGPGRANRRDRGRSAVVGEESGQHGAALGGVDPADDIGSVIQAGVAHHVPQRRDRACLRVVGAEHQPADAGQDESCLLYTSRCV